MKQPDLEFVWVGDDAVDPLEQAQTLNILVSAGIKTTEEARADLGLAPEGGNGAPGVGKYNHNHDERGRFATTGNAVSPGGSPKPAKPPKGIQVASLVPVAPTLGTDAAVTPDAFNPGASNEQFRRLPGESATDYFHRLSALIAERPQSARDAGRLADRLAEIRDAILNDPDLNAWRQNLNPDAYRDPVANGGRNPHDPFKDYKELPGGGSPQNAWIPEGGAVYERIAADGFVYTFPPSALVSGSPLGLLASIDDRFYHLTGNSPNWSDPAPGDLWSALPALDSAEPHSQGSESIASGGTNAARLPRFSDEDLLTDHFVKHGAEVGANSEVEYEAQAGQFLTEQNNQDIQEKLDYHGNTIRFNAKTKEFGILGPSGKIRTYYLITRSMNPFPTNQDYFDAQ
jgi:hypothetical protein